MARRWLRYVKLPGNATATHWLEPQGRNQHQDLDLARHGCTAEIVGRHATSYGLFLFNTNHPSDSMSFSACTFSLSQPLFSLMMNLFYSRHSNGEG